MKPQARIQALIDIFEKIEENTRVPMDTVVGDYMRHRRYIGAKDRRNLAERIYEIIRHHARLGWVLDSAQTPDTPRNRIIAYSVLCEGADDKRLKDLFDGSKFSPERLSDQELAFINTLSNFSIDHPDMPEDVACECPPLYAEKLKSYFGDDFRAEMLAMLEPATLDLRVNTFLCAREKAKNYLEADGVATEETPYSPWGLRCENKAYLSRTKAFAKGWVEIQDEGSQLIALVAQVRPGMQVLDYCAGAGGKTLALGAAMERKGRIVAMDNDSRRLEKGRQRYKKAQIADIIEVRSLEDDKNRKWLKRQKEKFDLVLTDVPCTGTGTWRRNPDMRWSVYGPSLEELTIIQADILERTAEFVKPGGALVYATCSLLPDENEAQVERFLKEQNDFTVEPIENKDLGEPFMRLTPYRHKTDGFFAAVLRKNI
ncbi:MAG: RsmB/NOP family class I SAM-dependent RNA methyltransferase [Alphaproteobacteria bacterium]